MKTKKEEFIELLTGGDIMNNIYGYAYKRCFSDDEAAELSQEIIVEVLFSLTNNEDIENLNAYIWRIANNTYINHVNRNKRTRKSVVFAGDMSYDMQSYININANLYESGTEDDMVERIIEKERLSAVRREIESLSKIYRDVIVMYYLEDLPVSVIAKRLDIPENRVKQRLYSAREKIKKEVSDMNTTEKAKQPAKLYELILANVGGIGLFEYDPRDKISSSLLRKNIVITCQNRAKTIPEISEELGVHPAIIADEIRQIPEDFIKQQNGNKYIANAILVNLEMRDKIERLTAEIATDYFKEVKEYLLSIKDKVMALPYINPPKSFEYLLWWYLPQFANVVKWTIEAKIREKLKEKEITGEERKMYLVCTILDPDNKEYVFKGKNHNGIGTIFNVQGEQRKVFIENISLNNYLPMEKGRFFADRNFDRYPELAMVFLTIGGLDVNSVEEKDREAAAKALEKGLIRKENGKLYPEIIIGDWLAFESLKWLRSINENAEQIYPNPMKALAEKYASKMADTLWELAEKYLPRHLLYLSEYFADGTFCLEYYLLDEGVKDGLLYSLPETSAGAAACTEGIFAVVVYPDLGVDYEMGELKNGFLGEYKISRVISGSIGERIGMKKGDIMTAVNGTDFVEYLKSHAKVWGRGVKEGMIFTVMRDGEYIDFTVTF